MSIETRNAELVGRLYEELFTDWKLDVIERYFADDFHSTQMPAGTPRGPAGVRQFYGWLRSAFPDLTYGVDDLIAQGDKVVVRWHWNATHEGPFRGIAPTGTHVAISGIAIYRVQDGKLAQRWVEADLLGLFRTLGAELVPPRP